MENTRELDIKMVLALGGEIEERQDPIAGSVTYGRVPSIGIDDFRPMYSLQFTQNWGLTGPLIAKHRPDFMVNLVTEVVTCHFVTCDFVTYIGYGKTHLESFCNAFHQTELT